MSKIVYLAGPDVFRKDAAEHFKNIRDVMLSSGLYCTYPADNDDATSHGIFKANIKMIEDCDFVLANLDIFRSPSVDPGTAFEMGYGLALGKRIVGYFNSPEKYNYYSRAKMFGVQEPYTEIEDFNLFDNLMIAHSCEAVFDDINFAIKYIAMEARNVS